MRRTGVQEFIRRRRNRHEPGKVIFMGAYRENPKKLMERDENKSPQVPLDNITTWGLADGDMPDYEPVEWCDLCGEAEPVCRCVKEC